MWGGSGCQPRDAPLAGVRGRGRREGEEEGGGEEGEERRGGRRRGEEGKGWLMEKEGGGQ